MAGSPVSRALRTFKVAEAEFVAAKCYALRAMIGTRTDPTAVFVWTRKEHVDAQACPELLARRAALDLVPGGGPTTAAQESRHAEGLRPLGRSVQRTRGADIPMMARRTGNPRLARHHNKRKREVQAAIEAERC